MTLVTVYLLALVLAMLTLACALTIVWFLRGVPGARWLLVLGGIALLWSFMAGVVTQLSPEIARAVYIHKFTLVSLATVTQLAFVLNYFRPRAQGYRYWILALSIVPAITLLLSVGNDEHQLVLTTLEFERSGGFTRVSSHAYGPWYWIHSLHAYALVLASAVVIGITLWREGELARRQAKILLLGASVPLGLNFLLVLEIVPRGLDLMPFAVAATALSFIFGVLRLGLLDLAPVARGRLIETIPDGVLVVDASGRIADMNPAISRILPVDRSWLGLPFDALASGCPELFPSDGFDEGGCRRLVVIGQRDYELRVLPLVEGDRRQGTLHLFVERTAERRAAREREALIEQLVERRTDAEEPRSVLPMCASCRRVRVEDREVWLGLEAYLRAREGTEFSHGLCPSCASFLYPDVFPSSPLSS